MLLILLIGGAILMELASLTRNPTLNNVASWTVMLALFTIISCADLLFIRLYWGKQAWEERQAKARTRWGLAWVTTSLFSLAFSDIIAMEAMRSQAHLLLPIIWAAGGIGFVFFLSIFRDQPTRLRGILAYGCLAVYLTIFPAIACASGH